jgi:hypothetical protein
MAVLPGGALQPLYGLEHVLWIGGTSASGKTTIAGRLAKRHGLRLYSADTRTWAHRDRAIREGNAAAIRWEAMTPRERWEKSTPAEMLEMSLHRERGAMIVDDLRRLPASPLILAEGTPVSPSAVADRARAVWLIATPEFQRAQLSQRGLEPEPTELYLLLAAEIDRQAREHDMPVLTIDGSRGVGDVLAAVEALFADALAEGPCAETVAERRELLREANEAIVAQVRDYYGRPWADRDPDEVVRTFLCECGDASCVLSVDVNVRVAAAAPVFATEHA